MRRILSFDYDQGYDPSAPFIEISIDGYNPAHDPMTVTAFVDSGADGTMLPVDMLEAIDAEYVGTVILRGTAGGRKRLDRFMVRVRIGSHLIHAVKVAASLRGSEPIIGRDILNHLVVTLNGSAYTTEILMD